MCLLVAACLLSAGVSAQVTKVSGRVIDAQTGEPLPYTGVFFENTSVGQATNEDGYYSFETTDLSLKVLCTQLTGYESDKERIVPGRENKVDFSLMMTENDLDDVDFTFNQKAYIRAFLEKIDEARDRNNPEKRPQYESDLYSKIRIDLDNAEERIKSKKVRDEIGFVFQYMDSSEYTGNATLPTLISETQARRYHISDPLTDQEMLLANRVSGVRDVNILDQYMGSLQFKINFYEDFIELLSVKLPSPLQRAGQLYYKYYIVDSIRLDGRKTFVVHVRPKGGSTTPVFDGEMLIDAEDYALRSIQVKMLHGSNVNWIRNAWFSVEYRRLDDSTWFHDKEHAVLDLSLTARDSSQMMSFTAHRELVYTNPKFENVTIPNPKAGLVYVDPKMEDQDEAYWDSIRPVALDTTDKQIYQMVDSVKSTSFYKRLFGIANMLATSYYDIPSIGIGIGNYTNILSFNDLEGVHLGIGFHTTKDFSRKYRFKGNIAWGTKDHVIKGGGGFQWLFSRNPYRTLTAEAKYDIYQLGRNEDEFTEANILVAIFSKQGGRKLTYKTEASLNYDHEFTANVNTRIGYLYRNIESGADVPMIPTNGDEPVKGLTMNEFHVAARFSKDEKVNRGHFVKTYVYSDHPVVTLCLYGSVGGGGKYDVTYLRPELSIDYRHRFGPVGMTKVSLSGGTVIGDVPYPFLHIHEGNGTFILDRNAFACMDFMEFASDTWGTLFFEHSFDGFFLGRIPGISKLNLREIVLFKMTYGRLSDKNNGVREQLMAGDPHALGCMVFPEDMRQLKTPYMEIGCGLSNIFKIIRVDFSWRLTHMTHERNGEIIKAAHPFSVNVGADIRF